MTEQGTRMRFSKRERSRSDDSRDNQRRNDRRTDNRRDDRRDDRRRNDDPYTADKCMSFREFSDLNQRGGKSDDELFLVYCEYKSDHEYRICREYFDEHKNEEWLREKYHPVENKQCVATLNHLKQSAHSQFITHLTASTLDTISYSTLDSSPLSEIHPVIPCLMIRGVPMNTSRVKLEAEITKTGVEGFEGLVMLVPSMKRGGERRGFAVFTSDALALVALPILNAMDKVKDVKVEFVAQAVEVVETRTVQQEYSSAEQIRTDLDLSTNLIATLDAEASLNSASTLSNRIDDLFPAPSADDMDTEAGVTQADAKRTKHLDLNILYLRFVHGFTFYTGHESLLPVTTLSYIRRTPSLAPPSRPDTDTAQKQITRLTKKILTRTTKPTAGPEITSLGGRCTQESIDRFIGQVVKSVSDGDKFMCRECDKMFKGDAFCRKHVEGKHGDIVEGVRNDLEFFNGYVRDYERVGALRDVVRGDSKWERETEERRESIRNYVDLDGAKHDRPVISYDY